MLKMHRFCVLNSTMYRNSGARYFIFPMENDMATNLYTGFHGVEEKVRRESESKNRKQDEKTQLHIYYSKPGPRIRKILGMAKEANIECTQLTDKELDEMCKVLPEQSRDHRGIVLSAEGEKARAVNDVELQEWLKTVKAKSTVIILDGVTDPHNVGAILRSCDQFGADLLVVPQRNSPKEIQENEIIARTSAGSSAWVSLAVVTNLVRTVEQLKEAGFWVYGADAGGESLQKNTFAEKTCIIMGSEGNGMGKLLSQKCDSIVSIPTCGKIDSLNVSVAAGVLLYERHRQGLINS